jgi:hypothetical protein
VLVALLVGFLVGWLVGEHLLLRDFVPYVIIFTNACVVITAVMVWSSVAVKGF